MSKQAVISMAAANVRSIDDELLQEWASHPIQEIQEIAQVESAARAEIRLVRGEFSGKHDASWYASRQTEEQWLGEIGSDADPFWSASK